PHRKSTRLERGLFPEDMELKIWDEIRDKLKEIDISRLTPLEALNILQYLKNRSDNFKKSAPRACSAGGTRARPFLSMRFSLSPLYI
ncbi:MAG: hypothetical protein MUC33_23325, partial [Desulfobacterales bacterium]|nr:hypothetical protein [Desulfobacterales bacterium]